MRLLIDTHVFLWFTSRPKELAQEAFLAIEEPDNEVFISVAVAWEIFLKHAKGKLSLPIEPALYVPARLNELGLRALPIRLEHALAISALPAIHADPFDRIMVAQAQIESLVLVTRDPLLQQYPVRTLPA